MTRLIKKSMLKPIWKTISSQFLTSLSFSTKTISGKDIFDRNLKKRQQNAAFNNDDSEYFDYLKVINII